MGCFAIIYKTQERHASFPLKNSKSFVIELSELKFKTHTLFDELLKRANKMQTGSVMGATPEDIWVIIFCKV